MDYKKLYFNLIDRIRELNHTPQLGFIVKHGIIPPAAGGSINRGFVHVRPDELFVLRRLLVKMYPGNGSVWHAFEVLKTEYFARNNKEYLTTAMVNFFEYEIRQIDDDIAALKNSAWTEATYEQIEFMRAKQKNLRYNVKELEADVVRRASRTVEIVDPDPELDFNAALLNETQKMLNTPAVSLGTTRTF